MQKLVTNSNTFEILSKRFLSLILRQMMTLLRKNLFFAWNMTQVFFEMIAYQENFLVYFGDCV